MTNAEIFKILASCGAYFFLSNKTTNKFTIEYALYNGGYFWVVGTNRTNPCRLDWNGFTFDTLPAMLEQSTYKK